MVSLFWALATMWPRKGFQPFEPHLWFQLVHHELPSLFLIVVDGIPVKLHRQEFGHRNLRRQFKKIYILAVSVKIAHTTLI